MKATGEVMAIDRSFEGALQKAVRSLETERQATSLWEDPAWTSTEAARGADSAAERPAPLGGRGRAAPGRDADADSRRWSKIDLWFLDKLRRHRRP